ncbi:TraR/DksA family transcriptional regulator [Lutibaculum baratangense]|uniref:Putative dnaK suppressor protein n=1 Tax=Lutibaculum baratangense AMV1 TaxID=631454 RepID=V4RQN9_9HYPH|nr:TraR/DksA C4-type zinc finger protein [Lutibaculum baratangense]ESR25440.1 putative dnaK suppressor protein [Lutibaculum baratangense AMV1]
MTDGRGKGPDLAAIRKRIEAELAELQDLSASSAQERAPVRLDQQSVGRLARMDAMQIQAMAKASEVRRAARINRLKAALRDMEEGEYGHCENCGEPIAEGRLKVDPVATLCVPCARLEER